MGMLRRLVAVVVVAIVENVMKHAKRFETEGVVVVVGVVVEVVVAGYKMRV